MKFIRKKNHFSLYNETNNKILRRHDIFHFFLFFYSHFFFLFFFSFINVQYARNVRNMHEICKKYATIR